LGVPIDEGSAKRSETDVVVVVGCVGVVEEFAALAGCEPLMTFNAIRSPSCVRRSG
jgi:hypothetical protein